MIKVYAPNPTAGLASTLVVGDMATWIDQGRKVPTIDGYAFVDVEDLDLAFVELLSPEVILSALVGPNFDAIEVARKLDDMGFAGAYRVVTQNVPNIPLIVAELRSAAPKLDVDVIDLSDIFPRNAEKGD